MIFFLLNKPLFSSNKKVSSHLKKGLTVKIYTFCIVLLNQCSCLLFNCCFATWERGLLQKYTRFVFLHQISVPFKFNPSCVWLSFSNTRSYLCFRVFFWFFLDYSFWCVGHVCTRILRMLITTQRCINVDRKAAAVILHLSVNIDTPQTTQI